MASSKALVVVGLDYGTSSTKLTVRRYGDRIARVVAVAGTLKSLPWFAVPSDVFVDANGDVWFGADAWRESGGAPVRWLKIILLADPGVPPPRGVPEPARSDVSYATLLATGFLAWVMACLRKVLDREYGPDGYRALVQTGAPLAPGLAAREVRRERFLRMMWAAWESAFGNDPNPIEQGIPLDTLRNTLAGRLREDAPLPGPGERLFDVLPESLAALETVRDQPDVSYGFHTIVDVGAGTTESMIVRHFQPEYRPDGRTYQLYGDATIRCGVADLEGASKSARRGHVGRLQAHLTRQLRDGLALDGPNRFQRMNWSRMTVMLIGGGSRHPVFRGLLLGRGPWRAALPKKDRRIDTRWFEPSASELGILETLWSGRGASRDGFFLLAVAIGLAKHRREWGRYFEPEELEPIPDIEPEGESDMTPTAPPRWV
ncbi:MAG: hypothetical protein IPM29_27420 [Planctomycetes bacterium]|nr:hypothetical protein [Planctomycetota bacterium]